MKMDNRKTYSETEQEAVEEELRENDWQREWAVKSPMYIDKMNQLLQEGTKESREQLKNMFLDQEFFGHYRQVDTFATMYVVMSIYELEVSAGICNTILEQGRSVEELLDYMFQLKMILYRLDFEIDSEAEEEFLLFLKQRKVSTVVISIMMTTMAMRPLSLALKLEKIFEKQQLYTYLFSILCFIEEHWNGSWHILRKISKINLQLGNKEDIQEYQKGLPIIPFEMEKQREKIFDLQELLWKLLYKENVEKKLLYFLENYDITDEIWEFLMKNFIVEEKTYYLKITNILFEGELSSKAEITLKYARNISPGDELILCLLAENYIKRGELEQALGYLDEIKEPGDLTRSFRSMCEKLMSK